MKQKRHPTGDHILNLLANVSGVVGDYVTLFPGKERTCIAPSWLEDWFRNRSAFYLHNLSLEQVTSFDVDQLATDVLSQQVAVVKKPVTLLSIWPHYFRGFRDLPHPINLAGKLVVIDGRNSSGKTSLAEAFEWLLSGQLVRRSLNDMGDSKELENCISSQLRPDHEATWVEAELMTTAGERLNIKRSLIRDYGEKKSFIAESQLYVNGMPLSTKNEEDLFLDELFAGIPPVLMQHSLRTFVSSTPSQRRNYFERLLRVDELAYLIEKSVIGDARFSEFPSSTGSVVLKGWEELKTRAQPNSVKRLKKAEKLTGQLPVLEIEASLHELAKFDLGIDDATLTLDEVRREIENIQKQRREKGFPLLEILRPQKAVDQQLLQTFSEGWTRKLWGEISELAQGFEQSQQAAEKIGEAQVAIAQAFEWLSKAGTISDALDAQACPFCAYEPIHTLTHGRIVEITSWQPIQKAAQEAKEKLNGKLNELKILLDELSTAKDGLIPAFPKDEEWENAIANTPDPVKDAVNRCKTALEACIASTSEFTDSQRILSGLLKEEEISLPSIQAIGRELSRLQSAFPIVIDKASEYLDGFRLLDNAVGKQAREDPDYNLREVWVSISEKREDLFADLQWEKAKRLAQKELEDIRDVLVLVREKLIETRRIAFSEGMTTVWGKLRSERYSTFSRLFIPPSRGKGLPLEIEVKAILDGGEMQEDGKPKTKEVDALRVFSESQINILGLAAFATRSKLLGHKLIVLDDPVQSMDEDHFKTFCTKLLPELLIADGQVIILTHNDTFAREISYSAFHMDDYVTMQVRHSRREGCIVEEGNRRVAERLKRAEKLCEDGKCCDAWLEIRKAIERLYIVTYVAYGPQKFNPLSWVDQTAESMWDDKQGGGVGPIIESRIPGISSRLKEILSLTAAGAHDKAAKGSTDIENAIEDLRKVMIKLQVGG